MAFAKGRNQGSEQIHLADADGMEPGDRLFVRVGNRDVPKDLGGQIPAIATGHNRTPNDPRREQCKCKQIEKIEQEHGESVPCWRQITPPCQPLPPRSVPGRPVLAAGTSDSAGWQSPVPLGTARPDSASS